MKLSSGPQSEPEIPALTRAEFSDALVQSPGPASRVPDRPSEGRKLLLGMAVAVAFLGVSLVLAAQLLAGCG